MNSKIKFLHVVQDDKKFFDTIISKFEEDNRLENRCVMLVKDEKDAFKSINPTEIVFACILATFISTIAGLIFDRILAGKYKKC